MINPFQLNSTLQQQIVLKGVNKRKMMILRKKILKFEEEFLSVEKIPIQRAREYIRHRIIEECSDLLEERSINKIVVQKNQHSEMYNIWKL